MGEYGEIFSWGTHSHGSIHCHKELVGDRLSNIDASESAASVISFGRGLRWLQAPQNVSTHDIEDVAVSCSAIQATNGKNHAMLVTKDGSVFSWGCGKWGQLGLGSTFDSDTPQLVKKLQSMTVVQAAVGEEHSVAITTDGGVYTWGSGFRGQTGSGYTAGKAKAIATDNRISVAPRFVSALLQTPISRIACGASFTVAISQAGSLWAWGEGGSGQLGIGRITQADHPQLVLEQGDDDSPFADVACGWCHSLAVTASQQVYAWGLNVKGQLGLGDTTTRFLPVRIESGQDDIRYLPSDPQSQVAETQVFVADEELLSPLTTGRTDGANSNGGPATARTAASANDTAIAQEPKLERPASPAGLLEESLRRSLTFEAGSDLAQLSSTMQHKALEMPRLPPLWDAPAGPFLVARVSCGTHHSAAVTEAGVLYVWGCPSDGRLGLSEAEIVAEQVNGDVVLQHYVNITRPRRLRAPALVGRVVAEAACSDKRTYVIAPAVLQQVAPASGFDSGNSRVVLSGPGVGGIGATVPLPASETIGATPVPRSAAECRDLQSRVSLHSASTGATTTLPGELMIPGVMVRFTRHATLPPPRDPELDDEDEEDMEEEDLGQFEELIKYVPAYRMEDDSDAIQCITPAFPNPCDVGVEIVVGIDLEVFNAATMDPSSDAPCIVFSSDVQASPDSAFAVVRGSHRYAYFKTPEIARCNPEVCRLDGGVEVIVGGNGLFGCMMSDSKAREHAEELVATAEVALQERDASEAAAYATGAGARLAGSTKRLVFSTDYGGPEDTHDVQVRFTVIVDSMAVAVSEPVPGWYTAEFIEPEPKPELDDDESSDGEEEEPDIMNNFHASVSCIMPALQLPKEYRQPSKLAPDHTGEATWSDFRRYQIRADVSPNGVDFLPCQRLISSYLADFDSITPTCCRIGSGDELQIRGSGFISAPQVCVRIRHEGGEAVVPAAVQNPTLITLPMPSLPLRIATTPDSPVADSEGDGQEGDGTAAEPAAAGSEAPSAPEEETDHAEAVTAATSELASGNVSCFAEVSFDGGATYAGGDVLCPFVVYKGQLADAVQPKTCPLGGGVTLSIAEADPADPWLFDSGSAVVYIENKSFAAEVPLAIDPDSHAIQFKMPALERNKYDDLPGGVPPTTVTTGDEEGSGGGGDEAEDAEPAGPPAPLRTVTISWSLNGRTREPQKVQFQYYDPESIHVKSIDPPKAASGATATLTVHGDLSAGLGQHALRITQGDTSIDLPVEFDTAEPDDDEEDDAPVVNTVTFTLPSAPVAATDDLPAQPGLVKGPATVEVTIDGEVFTTDSISINILK